MLLHQVQISTLLRTGLTRETTAVRNMMVWWYHMLKLRSLLDKILQSKTDL